MTSQDHKDLMKEQIEYYSAQANEYDQWFLRNGRFDKGISKNDEWFAEVEIVRQALADMSPFTKVLELACGTGLWTERLAKYTKNITAVDASTEMIAKNKERMSGKQIKYIQADIFTWEPQEKFEVVFFSFWMSHVPPEKFNYFWEIIAKALAPNGRVFFIDTLYNLDATANNQDIQVPEDTVAHRILNDGSEFEIIKVFYQPQKLQAELTDLGWQIDVKASGKYFLYGEGIKN